MPSHFYAAIDASNGAGTVYGIGSTPKAALAEALRAGDPCVTHEDREEGHEPADHFRVVPCSFAAYAWITGRGGAPSADLTVTRDGVCLREEETYASSTPDVKWSRP